MKKYIAKYIPSVIKKFIRYLIIKIKRYKNIEEEKLIYQIVKDDYMNGIMLDVGACVGASSKVYADLGWKIYAFEPDSKNRKKLKRNYEHYDNVIIEKYAVSNKNQKEVSLYSSKISSGISSINKFDESHEITDKIETITLSKYLEINSISKINLLKIDTEGNDFFVLQGFPWNIIIPDVIICEYENKKTEILGYNYQDMIDYLVKQNYKIIVSEWHEITKYGSIHNWRCFHTDYTKLISDRSWGNILCFKDVKIYNKFLNKYINTKWP